MIVNADKFQAIILNKKESEAKYQLLIDNGNIKSTKSWYNNRWPPVI